MGISYPIHLSDIFWGHPEMDRIEYWPLKNAESKLQDIESKQWMVSSYHWSRVQIEKRSAKW